jgi:hypothetical protein
MSLSDVEFKDIKAQNERVKDIGNGEVIIHWRGGKLERISVSLEWAYGESKIIDKNPGDAVNL